MFSAIFLSVSATLLKSKKKQILLNFVKSEMCPHFPSHHPKIY